MAQVPDNVLSEHKLALRNTIVQLDQAIANFNSNRPTLAVEIMKIEKTKLLDLLLKL